MYPTQLNNQFGQQSQANQPNSLSQASNPRSVSTVNSSNSFKGKASDQLARIYREEWQDYLNRFAPAEQKLIDMATGTQDNEQAIDRARSSAAGAFDSANAGRQRDFQRLGLSESQDERAFRERRSARQKKVAEVDAANKARLHTQDRDLNLMAGDMAVGLRDSTLNR